MKCLLDNIYELIAQQYFQIGRQNMHKLIHCMFNDLGLLKPRNTIISRYFLGTDDKRFKPKSASACGSPCGCRKF